MAASCMVWSLQPSGAGIMPSPLSTWPGHRPVCFSFVSMFYKTFNFTSYREILVYL